MENAHGSRSLVEIENESIQLENLLKLNISSHQMRKPFLVFFQHLSSHEKQHLFQSYYLQFESFIPHLIRDITSVYQPPEFFLQFSQIVNDFARFCTSQQSREDLERASVRLLASTALAWLYVGDPEQAQSALGIDFELPARTCGSETELDAAIAFLHAADHIRHPALELLKHNIQKWQRWRDQSAPSRINVLLVDQAASFNDNYHQGVISEFSGEIRDHLGSTDNAFINNSVHKNDHHLQESLVKGIEAGRKVASPWVKNNKHYDFHFSLSDQNADLGGASLGLATGILACSLLQNHYYQTEAIKISRSFALTGRLTSAGGIESVDEKGLAAKTKAAFFSPLTHLLVPYDNLQTALNCVDELRATYPNRALSVQGMDSLTRTLEDRNLILTKKISIWRKMWAPLARTIAQLNATFTVAMTVFFLLLITLLFIGFLHKKPPAKYALDGSQLHIYDADGTFLWSHDFGTNLTKFNKVIIKDIDADGRQDILFSSYDNENARFSGNIWRFDYKGRIKWQRHIGRELSIAGETFQDHFRIASLVARDLDKDGIDEIIAISHQYPAYPAIVQVLTGNGRVLGEWGHSGQLDQMVFHDLNQDGVDEIIVGGQNNEYDCAVLAVLDFRAMQGWSPQTPGGHYEPDSLIRGSESYYLKLPHTIFQQFSQSDQLYSLAVQNSGILVAVTNLYPNFNWSFPVRAGFVYYEFNRQFEQIAPPAFGDAYVILLRNRFNIAPDEEFVEPYRNVLYWDGEKWTKEATMNYRNSQANP